MSLLSNLELLVYSSSENKFLSSEKKSVSCSIKAVISLSFYAM